MAEKRTKKSEPASGGKIRIQYYRSFIATRSSQADVAQSGSDKVNQIVERPDNIRCAALCQIRICCDVEE